MQGAVEGRPACGWLGGYGNVSHELDNHLNVSRGMSYGVLECDIVMLQNYMLMIS